MRASGVLQAGLPTGVGSLPYDDAATAAIAELQLHPELPAAPQLPRRDAAEAMLSQLAACIDGVAVQADGRLKVSARRVVVGERASSLDAGAWGGTLAFLTAATGRSGPIKLQSVGPVTLGVALIDAGVDPATAFKIAGEAVGAQVQALVSEARRRVPDAPIVFVLDEPSLTRAMHPGFPLLPDQTIDLLSGGLATATSAGAAVNGIHCCGAVDWTLALHAGPDLVSLPATADVMPDAAALAGFLDRGGWVAWGVVPTDRPFGGRPETHWHRLNAAWTVLTAGGCDPVRLRTQAILTPACGLASHGEAQVPVVMALVRRVAERVQDQAYAARMSVGA